MLATLRQAFYIAALIVVCTIATGLTFGLVKAIVDALAPLP